MKITQEMLNEFNNLMELEGSVIRLKTDDRIFDTINIKLPEDKNVYSFILNPTDEWYNKLENFFKQKGIPELKYNNTGSCFWQIKN